MTRTSKNVSLILILLLLTVTVFSVISCGDSGVIPVPKDKLPAPSGLRLEEGFLCWNPVEYATRYIVSIDGKEYYCSDYKYSLSSVPNGEHVFKVKASGDDVLYQSSDFSDDLSHPIHDGYCAETDIYKDFDNLNESFLGYGFDVINSSVFSDKYVKTSFTIFNTDKLMQQRLIKVNSKLSTVEETYNSDIEKYIEDWNTKANVNASLDNKKFGGSVKLKVAFSGGVENAASKYFHTISLYNQKYYIIMQGDMAMYKDIISDGFKTDLYSDMEPAMLFDRYGTHFITSAVMGGKINSYYLYSSTEEKSYHDISGKVSAAVRYMTSKGDVSVSTEYRDEATTQNIDIRNTLEVIGGGDFGMLSDVDLKNNYAAWEKSLDINASLMGIKDTGSLQPIWGLIDPALDTKTYTWDYDGDGIYESGTRAEQLQAYFFAYGVKSYNELLESAALPNIVVPNEISSIKVNGTEPNASGEYEVFAGVANDITFTVLPSDAVGYKKIISLSEASDFASINEKNQLVISPNAPHNTTLTVVLSAGNVRKQIKVRISKSYTVDFETNCDAVIDSLIGVRHGKQIVEPVLEEREGYEFIGWYTTYDFLQGTEYQFGEQAIVSDLTLYARWQKFYPVITFKHNIDKIEQTTVKIPYNSVYEEPEKPKCVGYTFLGWFIDDEYIEKFDFSQNIIKHTKVYGKWVANPVVTFVSNVNGGAPEKVTVTYNTSLEEPQEPKLEGHVFQGWYADREYTEKFDFTQKLTKNVNVYVKYVPYPNITFISNVDGHVIKPITVIYNTSMEEPQEPKLAEHQFLGWYADKDYTEKFDFTQKITKNTNIYVKYAPYPVVTFVSNVVGGTLNKVTVAYNTAMTEPEEPTLQGHIFQGWYADKNFVDEFDFSNKLTENTTIYLKWEAIKYKIQFVSNGGTTVSEQIVAYGSKIQKPENVLKENYEFAGWYKDENLTSVFDFDLDTVKGDTTLYAKWGKGFIEIVFVTNCDINIDSRKIEVESSLGTNLPTLTRLGYEFNGWYTNETLESSTRVYSDTQFFNSTMLYAKWKPSEYVLTFDSMGGNVDVSDKIVTYNSAYGDLPTPTKIGYTFEGWYYNNQRVTSTTIMLVAESHSLTAQYVPNQYTVSFEGLDEGNNITVTYGATYGNLPSATKVGYDFVAWNYNGALITSDSVVSVANDHMLLATWTPKKYTVSFEGLSEENDVIVSFGTPYGELPIASKVGCDFAGWFYNDILITSETIVSVADNHTLKPKLTPKTYVVSFEGLDESYNITVEYGSPYGKLPTSTKTGHSFVGWYNNSALITEESTVAIPDNHTLSPKFEVNTYTITFNSNGGSAVSSLNFKYGQKTDAPSKPTKTDHIFMGWSFNYAGFSFGNYMPAANITATATWQYSKAYVSGNIFTVIYKGEDGDDEILFNCDHLSAFMNSNYIFEFKIIVKTTVDDEGGQFIYLKNRDDVELGVAEYHDAKGNTLNTHEMIFKIDGSKVTNDMKLYLYAEGSRFTSDTWYIHYFSVEMSVLEK